MTSNLAELWSNYTLFPEQAQRLFQGLAAEKKYASLFFEGIDPQYTYEYTKEELQKNPTSVIRHVILYRLKFILQIMSSPDFLDRAVRRCDEDLPDVLSRWISANGYQHPKTCIEAVSIYYAMLDEAFSPIMIGFLTSEEALLSVIGDLYDLVNICNNTIMWYLDSSPLRERPGFMLSYQYARLFDFYTHELLQIVERSTYDIAMFCQGYLTRFYDEITRNANGQKDGVVKDKLNNLVLLMNDIGSSMYFRTTANTNGVVVNIINVHVSRNVAMRQQLVLFENLRDKPVPPTKRKYTRNTSKTAKKETDEGVVLPTRRVKIVQSNLDSFVSAPEEGSTDLLSRMVEPPSDDDVDIVTED